MWENYGDKPPNPLNKTWVFKIKDKTHGEFKGRLCVQGFNQIHSTDYEETYTPNGKLLTLRILLLYSLHKNLKVTQFDVQGAFLHAHLSEDVSIKTSKAPDKMAQLNLISRARFFFHVDDLILVVPGNNFEKEFEKRFSNSSCHSPNTILGMKFKQEEDKIKLSLPNHIQNGLEELGLKNCKTSMTPLTPSLKL
ncbi:putative retroelement pol polyprotein [Puccinia sorghi]|uniref:Putative retroelement pol polyprotein n=1 Tax=Puccinia sorghi TaxID=27349 RepID=A0A0L6V9B1_9BASI|nr:putative retroelement pol polyprotein [Puccinia sorghi]